MRLFTFCFICLVCCHFSSAQIPGGVDSVYRVIRKTSIHATNANWTAIEAGLEQKFANAKNEEDSVRALVFVFEQLNDNHSGIFYNGNYFSNFPTFEDSTLRYMRPLLDCMQTNTGVFKAERIDRHYVYLQVPSVQASGEQVSAYAQMLADTLFKYTRKKTKGIVLDLRLNGGGQFSSMAAGLAPLLGNITLGGGIANDSTQILTTSIQGGNLFINGYATTSIAHRTARKLDRIPVVLLIGPITASSGSILTVSFKGRPRTYFIGEHTATGYSTGNDYFAFGSALFLNLSTTHVTDRNGVVYRDVVHPDAILTGEDQFDAIANDKKVQRALDWLKKN